MLTGSEFLTYHTIVHTLEGIRVNLRPLT